MEIDITNRNNIKIGMLVEIIAEEDRASQLISRGFIQEIITKDNRAKKISVRLTVGKKGIVQRILTKDEIKKENFKFYNLFFFEKYIYSIWNKKTNKYLVINYLNAGLEKNEKTAFLFTEEKSAKEFLSIINNPDYMVKSINRKKPIVENFKTLEIEYFRINTERKLSYERLIEWEAYFKNMR